MSMKQLWWIQAASYIPAIIFLAKPLTSLQDVVKHVVMAAGCTVPRGDRA